MKKGFHTRNGTFGMRDTSSQLTSRAANPVPFFLLEQVQSRCGQYRYGPDKSANRLFPWLKEGGFFGDRYPFVQVSIGNSYVGTHIVNGETMEQGLTGLASFWPAQAGIPGNAELRCIRSLLRGRRG